MAERRFLKRLVAAWVVVGVGAICSTRAAAEQSDLGHLYRIQEKIFDHLPEKIREHLSGDPLEEIKYKIHEAIEKHSQDGEHSYPEPPPIKEKLHEAIERAKEKIADAKERFEGKFENIKSKIDEIKSRIEEKHGEHLSDSDWPWDNHHLDPFHGSGWHENPEPAGDSLDELTDTFVLGGNSQEGASTPLPSSTLTDAPDTSLSSDVVDNPEPSAWILGMLALAAFAAFAARQTSRGNV